MAGIALDLRVCGPERKFRLFVVIEVDRDPLVLIVAAFAFGSIPSGVDVLNLVAIGARCADPLVALASMAGGARYFAMRALQRELGFVVVEGLDATPYGFAMTIVARFPQPSLMRIIGLMTIEAASGSIAELHFLYVTAAALHGLVSVPKLEIRKCVIECLTVEQEDVGIPSRVIGVALGAVLFGGIRLTPMKSFS